jgi:hypothetical protein
MGNGRGRTHGNGGGADRSGGSGGGRRNKTEKKGEERTVGIASPDAPSSVDERKDDEADASEAVPKACVPAVARRTLYPELAWRVVQRIIEHKENREGERVSTTKAQDLALEIKKEPDLLNSLNDAERVKIQKFKISNTWAQNRMKEADAVIEKLPPGNVEDRLELASDMVREMYRNNHPSNGGETQQQQQQQKNKTSLEELDNQATLGQDADPAHYITARDSEEDTSSALSLCAPPNDVEPVESSKGEVVQKKRRRRKQETMMTDDEEKMEKAEKQEIMMTDDEEKMEKVEKQEIMKIGEEEPKPKRQKVEEEEDEDATPRTCSACKAAKPKHEFSANQWRKEIDQAKCLPCVEEALTKGQEHHKPRRACFVCKAVKPRSDFSTKQWRKAFYEGNNSQCKHCAEAPIPPEHRTCSVCRLAKPRNDFSTNQWKKAFYEGNNSQCKLCAEVPIPPECRTCSVRRLAKPSRNDFSTNQWKKAFCEGNDSQCKLCACGIFIDTMGNDSGEFIQWTYANTALKEKTADAPGQPG